MFKFRKAVVSIAIALCALGLVGCSSSNASSSKKAQSSSVNYDKDVLVNYDKAKSIFGAGRVKKLSFFENSAWNMTVDGDKDDDNIYPTKYTLGYYDGNNLVTKYLSSNTDKWREVIDPNATTPYVIIYSSDDHPTYAIHRMPYTQYNQPAVKGTVTGKEEQ